MPKYNDNKKAICHVLSFGSFAVFVSKLSRFGGAKQLQRASNRLWKIAHPDSMSRITNVDHPDLLISSKTFRILRFIFKIIK
jgi:hypothetical protein